jgi:hypothetical protein
MRHSLERIKSKPQDYKFCVVWDENGCGEINWYEVDECTRCGNPNLQNATQGRVDDYCEDYAEAYPKTIYDAEIFVDFG